MLALYFGIHGSDFGNAGRASTAIKAALGDLGINPEIVRRAAICAYEAEMNVVLYADSAVMSFSVREDRIKLEIEDHGPGIEDIELAMQPGYSTATHEIQEMGFGAGLGLPNMRNHADEFEISSLVGEGTKVCIKINCQPTATR